MTISVILVRLDESKPLETHSVSWDGDGSTFSETISGLLAQSDYLETPLLRPRGSVAGLYVYYNVPGQKQGLENLRATRLAMACGLLSSRFWGDVLLVRSFGGRWEDLTVEEVHGACCLSPDLRQTIQSIMAQRLGVDELSPIPEWLADAAQQNYHDGAAMAKVVSAMQGDAVVASDDDDDDDDDNDNDNGGDNDNESDSDEDGEHKEEDHKPAIGNQQTEDPSIAEKSCTPKDPPTTDFVANSPLCLQCRRPTSKLCPDCEGAYFCPFPQTCRSDGWSHTCLCPTWKLYSAEHRNQLSTFGDCFGDWQAPLTGPAFHTSELPYEAFLSGLGIGRDCMSWWRTEWGGWSGGNSQSAAVVDASVRRSYSEGFAPILEIPVERRVTTEDIEQAGLGGRNEVGLLQLRSWNDYCKLRQIPATSPVALLCSFPLTLFHAIVQYGSVPVTVARMLKRPLRIHIVGAEKEMNFLDLFREVGYLLPEDLQVELVFVVRDDMLPPNCQSSASSPPSNEEMFSMRMEMTSNLTVCAVSGTYGASLDPQFDCGTGPPDMVVALNAGLYAYESWRSVVNYLYQHTGVVGVFTDYNEYSGVNCAALGGGSSRNSLVLNPFRQPRAMPVFSMNLPQFSNGYLYVFNEQELE